MRKGDVIINPYVPELFEGKPSPLFKTMVLSVGSTYTKVLRIDGKTSKYFTDHAKNWTVSHHIDYNSLILKAVYPE